MKPHPHPDEKWTIKIAQGGNLDLKIRRFIVPPGETIRLSRDYDPAYAAGVRDKKAAKHQLQENIKKLSDLQDRLYAQNTYALLLVIQALDAAGKDGLIKHVMSGVNPQGCQVFSFKSPSAVELDHDYLWRCSKALPERGRIGIFNRSYYEEVLIVRVHPEFLDKQKLPDPVRTREIWSQRFDQINQFEKYCVNNGIIVLKFYLNVSKEEQRQRFLKRINKAEKNWKFSMADIQERAYWDQYQRAYDETLNHTSTPWAPWYVIPADRKWFTRLAASEIMVRTLTALNLAYPKVSKQHHQELLKAKRLLEKNAK